MSVLDRIRNIGRQDKSVVVAKEESIGNYMKEAEKAAQIVEANINKGDYSRIVQQLESLPSFQTNRTQYVFEPLKTTSYRWIIAISIGIMAAYICLGVFGFTIVHYSEEFKNYGLMYVGASAAVIVVNVLLIRYALKNMSNIK